MKYKQIVFPIVSFILMAGSSRTFAQGLPVPGVANQPAPAQKGQLHSFKFESADLDTVMSMYSEWTGKIYLKNDAVKATITLKADRLTTEESIEVVEAMLAMNNIALVPMGEKFIKVVMANAPDLGGQGLTLNLDPDQEHARTDKLVTQIVQLDNVTIPDVQTAVQHLMHAYGKIQTLELSNSLLITDTADNIKRIRELITFLDQASARIETKIHQVLFADATELASKLNEIISLAQGGTSGSGSSSSVRTPPGVIRARTTRTAAPTQASISKTQGGNAMIIQGTVRIMADDRTNILLIFSQKENFEFFDKIIKVLDVEVDPAITFEVVNLEYADAEELSGTLNELVGAAQSSTRGSSSSTGNSAARSTTSRTTSSRPSFSSSRSSSGSSPTGSALQSLSKLSEDTKILADKRSNSIVLMGGTDDIAAIKQVIKSLDVMLEQVLIEAAIFEVQLDDTLEHGIQWLYNNVDGDNGIAGWGGNSLSLISSVASNIVPTANSLTYYKTFAGINTDVAIRALKKDGNAKLLSTPVVMTTDNTEATITIGEQRPIVTATETTTSSLNSLRSQYEYKDIGIQLTVTPRINPQRFVVMEINQKADQIGGSVPIDNNNVPIILNREIEASIAVPDRGTIALGGLVSTEKEDTLNKIPLLGDIPFIGRYLFSSVTKTDIRRELLVLLTPYVLTTPEEMMKETRRLHDGTALAPEDWPKGGWSASALNGQKIEQDEEVTEQPSTPSQQQSTDAEVARLLQQLSEE